MAVLAGCLALSSATEIVSEGPQRVERTVTYWWCEAPYGKRFARETSFRVDGVGREVGTKDETLWSEPISNGDSSSSGWGGYGGY